MGQCGYARPGKEGGIPKALGTIPRPLPSIHDLIDAVILSTFAADSLALSSHWEFRPHTIAEKLGQVTKFGAPRLNTFNMCKEAGDQSPDGDHALFLLMHISEDEQFDLLKWAVHWRYQWSNSETHKDHATKDTLAAMEEDVVAPECASETQLDIGPAARFFPLLALNQSESEFVKSCIAQASLTHQQERVLLCTQYHAKLLYRVLHQRVKPSEELTRMSNSPTTPRWIRDKIHMAMASQNEDDWQVIVKWGQPREVGEPHARFTIYAAQAGDVDYTYPLVLHFILKYESNEEPLNAIIRNIAIGGYTTTRSLMIACILYAYHYSHGHIPISPSSTTSSPLTSDKLSSDPDIHQLIPQLSQYQHIKGWLTKLRDIRE